jgi:ribosomal protein S27AE
MCVRCGEPFASVMMVRDLITVERQLGFSYETEISGVEHYQQVCPKCRRALFGLAQGRMWNQARSEQLSAVRLIEE